MPTLAATLGIDAHLLGRVELAADRIAVDLADGRVWIAPPNQPCFAALPHLSLSYAGQHMPPGLAALWPQLVARLTPLDWTTLTALVVAAPSPPPLSWRAQLERQPYIDLGLVCTPAPLLAELTNLRFVAEPQRAADGRGWSSLALRNRGGVDGVGTAHNEDHAELAWAWTPTARDCPKLCALVAGLVDLEHAGAVHAMRLDPGGFIAPHADARHSDYAAASVFNGTLNVALSHPPECRFVTWLAPGGAETVDSAWVPFAPGRGFVLDVGRWHRIDNPTASPRIHLVIRSGPEAWRRPPTAT